MRIDMFKVVVERPRCGAGHAPSPKLKRTPDPDIQHIGHKRHASIATPYRKGFSENLAPLVRFLRSRRGKPWDETFSEICANLDTGSTIKMHVRLHLEDYVLTPISIGRRGEWVYRGEVLDRGGRRPWRWEFFVDPGDGLLKDISTLAQRLPGAQPVDKRGER